MQILQAESFGRQHALLTLGLIKNADYIIDLGPGAGDRGGYVVATGTPEEVAGAENSYTGQFLKKLLRPR